MKQTGTFYGIGVGPGDPELITLKAVRLIRECDRIVLPVSKRTLTEPVLRPAEMMECEPEYLEYLAGCTAYQIAVQAVPELREKRILVLPMPMIKDKVKLKEIHNSSVRAVTELLAEGEKLVFLTLGDPTVYSTCMYIEQMVESSGYPVETVPGIPSFCAAAAKLNRPLGEQEEQIHILPASYEIGESLKLPGTKILMKAGRKMGKVKELLEESGQEVTLIENCGMQDERIFRSVEEIPQDAGYYSLLVVKENE